MIQKVQIIPDFSDAQTNEKYSSAFTLSDMEIFVFPELLYPLVLANIMSPILWSWRDDPWFRNITKKSFTYKVNRIKQYVMDHYTFNLDLETWGITHKNTEMERFGDFIDLDILKKSNALFGYEGDKYYFDRDIRRHFGLDKYNSDIIPYWKTETIEAMTAFRHTKGTGAGECVSLSALYAAALFVVGHISLENIFLIATPLHSQNYIAVEDGLITNNRRIVTKKMWYNGTPLSAKARRALEKEKVTIVSHLSGYIHHIYETATIRQDAYAMFSSHIAQYLATDTSWPVFISFLRSKPKFQQFFQYRIPINNRICYLEAEKLFAYELKLSRSFLEQNVKAFFQDLPEEEFSLIELDQRIVLQDLEFIFQSSDEVDLHRIEDLLIEKASADAISDQEQFKKYVKKLYGFVRIEPRLPSTEKEFRLQDTLNINTTQSRDQIIGVIRNHAVTSETALLALYVYRDMNEIDWTPFIKAALERNPVSINGLKGQTVKDAYHLIHEMPNTSIYDSGRMALPDEVWNFGRGDGVEKAFLLANYIRSTQKDVALQLTIDKEKVLLVHTESRYLFMSSKGLTKSLILSLKNENYCFKCS